MRTLASLLLAAVAASAAIGGASALIVSCSSPSRQDVSVHAPEDLGRWDALLADAERLEREIPLLEKQVQDAVASESPDDDLPAAEALAKANAELAKVELELAPLEEKINRRKAQPVADAAGSIHPLFGALAMLAIPLAGKRGRKLFVSSLRNAAGGQLLVAAGDILKMLGHSHSQPQPQSPAEGEQPQA